MRSIIKNKKGIIGEIMTTFIATIIIIVILVVFALGSYTLRHVKNIKGDTKILDSDIGLHSIYAYSLQNYPPWACLDPWIKLKEPGHVYGGRTWINGECLCDTSIATSIYNPNKNEPPCVLK